MAGGDTEVETRVAGAPPVTTAAAAADTVGPTDTVAVSGFGSVGYPKAVPLALAASDRDLGLTLVSGGSTGREIDTELVEADAIERRFPYQATEAARRAANEGRMAFHDRHIVGLSDEIEFGRLAGADVAVVEAVAVGEDWLIPSTSIGQTPAYVAAADALIVEVNDAQPAALADMHDVYRPAPPPDRRPIPLTSPADRIGTPRIRFDPEKLSAVVRTDRPDDPYTFRDPTDTDRRIAAHLTGFLDAQRDRDAVLSEALTLQFGVGSLGNALMGAIDDSPLADGRVRYFGEVIQDGLLDLLDADVLEAASATSLALSADGQDRLFGAVERYAEDVVLRPSDVSNSPALIDRFGVVAVNSAVSVDLYGHVNSTHIDGTRLVNGIGGSADFNRNAHLTVVACPSTAAGGEISRIVPFARHVDHTEHDVDAVVTEHGLADLRGRSPAERAETVIETCADPAYRPALQAYLERARTDGGHIAHDFEALPGWPDLG